MRTEERSTRESLCSQVRYQDRESLCSQFENEDPSVPVTACATKSLAKTNAIILRVEHIKGMSGHSNPKS
ncbi:hypothetical protein EUGRSUZ_F02246 [Eucalyptus grandis]|uniref:Uncharacterized protein n=2 Tax=Eucalyptus grandis TaxID=71139 RepID=A0ACC3KH66_EUCGR|nr:hypothetical protein EUGRSUZ_F02246 [Eucalyptus grandis]